MNRANFDNIFDGQYDHYYINERDIVRVYTNKTIRKSWNIVLSMTNGICLYSKDLDTNKCQEYLTKILGLIESSKNEK